MQTLKIRNLLWFLVGFTLVACAKEHAYSVDGVNDKFCVPKGYPPQSVWFVPDDTERTPHGFSFMGCKLLDASIQKSCTLPDGLIGADVMPLSVNVNHDWRELKEAAVFRSVVESPGAKYETDSKTGWLKVYNPKVWPEWLVWKKGESGSGIATNSMQDSDELVITCSGAAAFPGGSGGIGSPDEFVCERYVRGRSYAVQYRFVSKDPVPSNEEINQRDSYLFRQIDSWRCPG